MSHVQDERWQHRKLVDYGDMYTLPRNVHVHFLANENHTVSQGLLPRTKLPWAYMVIVVAYQASAAMTPN